jgi:hypothetical protein
LVKTETARRRVGLFQGVVGAVLFFVIYAAVPFQLVLARKKEQL